MDCGYCNNILRDPVILVGCGDSICFHCAQIPVTFCRLCGESTEKGYIPNKALRELLYRNEKHKASLYGEEVNFEPFNDMETEFVMLNNSRDDIPDTNIELVDHADHLVLVVHGIGDQTSGSWFPIDDYVQNFSRSYDQMMRTENLTSNAKADFRTIHWHTKIHKGSDALDESLERITPGGIKYIRDFANDYIVDVLLYLNELHNQKIIFEVTRQLNERYNTYKRSYSGEKSMESFKVSVIGHSLGSLILWDILSHQNEDGKEVYGTIHIP
eukprot:TRINITY_DN1329_c0_g1_i6.p2 TRINITY_DN1329_c0_g1~~TRINITY_DN1329_c0_g1_i6.p2  ORF type:complete len:271 (+),score=58.20 TRINITY_DN1329_c0_g1_i6:51-863(+)